MTHLSAETFEANARAALGDAQLRGALAHATGVFGERRTAAIAALPAWEALREHGRAVKARTLAELDRWLETFAANAEAAGAVVHWARDAAEACAIVAEIAERSEAELVVKSKSMTTEEIRLNAALEARGREVVETDLGEWIIQLAGEAPSHIIAPAIHKTKRQIAELFAEKIASDPEADIEELCAAARRVLRARFAAADLGVSGVNFGVAETGSILVLENEGNARMCTSLPRVHVAVMGIEKVIPRFADLAAFLRLLPRSGTGQHLTSYQSILTGPKRTPQGEGPAEMHVVLLDNGRSAMLRTEVTRQSLACIRCGACLNFCPVYQQVGGHAYGSVYPGPIGAVITPQLAGLEKAKKLPFASSLCGACRDVCPVKIDIPRLLLHLRAEITSGASWPAPATGDAATGDAATGDMAMGNAATRKTAAGNTATSDAATGAGALPSAARAARPPRERRGERRAFRLWAWAMSSARRYALLARLARVAHRLGLRPERGGALVRRLAPPVAAWTAARELRPLAPRSFRELWRTGRGPGDAVRSGGGSAGADPRAAGPQPAASKAEERP